MPSTHTVTKEWDAEKLAAKDRQRFADLVAEGGLFDGRSPGEYLTRRDCSMADLRSEFPDETPESFEAIVRARFSQRDLAFNFFDDGGVTAATEFRTGFTADDEEIVTTLGEALWADVTVEAIGAELSRVLATMPKAVVGKDETVYTINEDGSLSKLYRVVYARSDGASDGKETLMEYVACPRTTAAFLDTMGDAIQAVWRSEPLSEGGDPLGYGSDDIVMWLSNGRWVGLTTSEWAWVGN